MSLQTELNKAKRTGLALLLTNAMSFSTVAMEKGISNYSKEQAAVVNALSAVPVLYDLGFGLGHRVFYKDNNFIKTAESATGFRNLFPRDYLGKKE